MSQPIRLVIEHAQQNGGIVTIQEAIALGMSRSTVYRRVADGVLIALRPGILALPGTADPFVLALSAACAKLHAVVSHQAAAYLHDLDKPRYVKPTVSVPVRRSKEMAGVTVHQLTDLEPSHIVDRHGLPITSAERTVIDLGAVLHESHLGRIVDHGLASGLIDLSVLQELFLSLGRRGKPGTAALRKLLEVRDAAYIVPESELERRLIALLERAGLPPPVRQFRAPWLRSVNGRVDLAYPEHKLIIEADSRRWHLLMAAFETDRLRDNAAQLAGWRILRFTWAEITESPERVVATVLRAIQD